MKTVEKSKLSREQKTMIILAATLAGLIVLAIVFSIVSGLIKAVTAEKELPEIREEYGEVLYMDMPMAYKRVEEKNILSILVKNKNGIFDLTRPADNSEFWLGYTSADGKIEDLITYEPPILSAENGASYEDLYAKELNDGYGTIYMLSYLCSAIGSPYFTERIEFSEDKNNDGFADIDTNKDGTVSSEEKNVLLDRYGLSSDKVNVISFVYYEKDKDGKVISEAIHHVEIGEQALNGQGYYFRIDGRDCIYYSQHSYFSYGLMGFHSFIKGTLIANGLPADQSYEPLLTTSFKEWVNTTHKAGKVEEGSNALAKGDIITPIKQGLTYIPNLSGGYKSEEREFGFDLEALKEHPDFERIKETILSLSVGKVTSPKYLTLLYDLSASKALKSIRLDFGDKTELKYSYSVKAIEGIVDFSGGECVVAGTPVGTAKLLRISYTLTKEDGSESAPLIAVIDLSSELLPSAANTALSAASVGELSTSVSFDITYTKENSKTALDEYYLTDIVGIFNKEGKALTKVTADSYVSFRYEKRVNGEAVGNEYRILALSELKTNKELEILAPLYDILLGKKVGTGLDIFFASDTRYYEELSLFDTYVIDEVVGYVTSELIVSFKFLNSSERDPFFGESIYENNTTGKELYALNASACEAVIKRLGGLGEDTTTSLGLSGKTVAVGLTHEVMMDYGLYAYKIYFELPRDIYDKSAGSSGADDDADTTNDLNDWGWLGKIGFTLYISEEDSETGNRYVGSDMYDLVAEVPGDDFKFLGKSFNDFWARRSFLMVDYDDLTNINIDFYMDDVYGSYDFELLQNEIYVGAYEGKYQFSPTYFTGAQPAIQYKVNVTEGKGSMTNTELSKYLAERDTDKGSLFDFYNKTLGLSASNGEDTRYLPQSATSVAVNNFQSAFQVVFLSYYSGSLTEAEQEAAFNTEKLMTIEVKLGENVKNASPHYYVYDFYRLDDRRVMVATYQRRDDGSIVNNAVVSDFYVSTGTFKKIVGNWVNMLNCVKVDENVAYPDEK